MEGSQYPVPSCQYPVGTSGAGSGLLGFTGYWVPGTRSHLVLVALPSITVFHVVPSIDISNLNVYAVGDRIFSVKRPFVVCGPIFISLVQVQVSPSTVPFACTASP